MNVVVGNVRQWKVETFCTPRDHALRFGHGHRDPVVDRHERQRPQSIRINRAEVVDDPIVVRTDTRERQFPILQIRIRAPDGRGIDRRRVDTVDVHVLECGGPVVVAGRDLFPRDAARLVFAVVLLGERASGLESQGSLRWPAIETPTVTSISAAQHPRRLGLEMFGNSIYVGPRRFVDVVVGRNHRVLHGRSLVTLAVHRSPRHAKVYTIELLHVTKVPR